MQSQQILLFFFYFTGVEVSTANRECLSVRYNDFSKCSTLLTANAQTQQPPLSGVQTCFYEDLCNKTFRLVQIEYQPVRSKISHSIKEMFSDCCGTCAKPRVIENLRNNAQLNISTLKSADIIYPFFSFTSTKKIYGFWYLPIIDVPYAYYFQKAPTHEEAMNTMLHDFGELWPMLLICLVFALAAGLLIWVLDTWVNKDEFPRDFLTGWFEGFWWSFISMTTVGYGDKAPKSRAARIFSIGWILIGITIFSMLTASLSNIITHAESPPSTDMAGKKVGILKYRTYDATVVAKHGGRVKTVSRDNVTQGIDKLIDMLFSKDHLIDGFLLDKHAYMVYCMQNNYCHRFKKIIRSKKSLSEKYSFGALLRNENEYNYLRKYIEYNWFYFDTCREIALNEIGMHLAGNPNIVVFSQGSGLFGPIMIGFGATILVFFLLGFVLRLQNKECKLCPMKTEVEMN